MTPKLPLIELLYQALGEQFGIVVQTSDPERLRQKLYPIRKEHLEEFECLSFLISPTNPANHLWIVKTNVEDVRD